MVVTLVLNLIISLKQEAEQTDKEHIVENGTHAAETNEDGNLDDSIVMPSLLSFPPSCFISFHCVSPFHFHPVQLNSFPSVLTCPPDRPPNLIPFAPFQSWHRLIFLCFAWMRHLTQYTELSLYHCDIASLCSDCRTVARHHVSTVLSIISTLYSRVCLVCDIKCSVLFPYYGFAQCILMCLLFPVTF